MPSLPDTPSPTALLAVARLAAVRAGEHARHAAPQRKAVNRISRHDVKHTLDVACQQLATATILAAFPGHAILGEETAGVEHPAPRGVEWIIDPIDGTVNFFHGLPYWCCSVAARLDGVVQAGCVFAPEMHLVFEAVLDGPALCNGQPIACSDTDDLALALVHTGTDKAEGTAKATRFFDTLSASIQRPRIMGAAALDICMVARGSADGYFEHGIYLWDVAAASLILSRAGGTSGMLKAHGGYRMAYLASNTHLHAPLKACIEQAM